MYLALALYIVEQVCTASMAEMRACQTGQKQGSGKNEQVSGPSPYHSQTARGIAVDGDEGEVAERVVASLFEEPIRKTAVIETESTMTVRASEREFEGPQPHIHFVSGIVGIYLS